MVEFRNFPDTHLDDWAESLERVEAMDFDVLVPGHWPLGDNSYVTRSRRIDIARHWVAQHPKV